jgi:hypothetical protein
MEADMSDQDTITQALATAKPGTLDLGIRVAATQDGARPDLDGLRVKAPGNGAVYLIMDGGYRRWIPNPATYDNLFRNWDGIITDIDVPLIPELPALSNLAVLARRSEGETAQVYLISNGRKCWVTSPAAMDRYHFDFNKVQKLSPAVIDAIPNGPDINWPQ